MDFGFLKANKKQQLMLRKKFLAENGVLLMEDKLRANDGIGVGSIKLFRAKELEKATNNYAQHLCIGRGGYGTVYKGVLGNSFVAIKKSRLLDTDHVEQFVKELTILGQINHRNVVRLLGCCLETEVPLLVYEFISNNTLYHHIFHGSGILSWDNCLRIAYESASGLAYLHSDARMPIIHRDVKSANIMLDENYTAKIIDFGGSRLVPLDVDHVTTLVQGTLGYLDPEYFHTSQLTDKSDVYSFGVVLAELMTRRKPIDGERPREERNLATYFMNAKRENRWHETLDSRVVTEATEEQLKAACDLVSICLEVHSEDRPSMKEVTMELKHIKEIGQN